MASVTRDTLIGDMVKQFPAAAEIVSKYGVHCVGCSVSQFEKLGDGLSSHGYDSEKIDSIISEVNEFLDERNIETSDFLSVSEKAASKVKEFAAKDDLKEFYLRADVHKGGCAGNTTTLDFTTEKKEDDFIVSAHGIQIIMSPESKEFLEGAVVEYVETLNESGFKIHNPNARKSCACGSSFMV